MRFTHLLLTLQISKHTVKGNDMIAGRLDLFIGKVWFHIASVKTKQKSISISDRNAERHSS